MPSGIRKTRAPRQLKNSKHTLHALEKLVQSPDQQHSIDTPEDRDTLDDSDTEEDTDMEDIALTLMKSTDKQHSTNMLSDREISTKMHRLLRNIWIKCSDYVDKNAKTTSRFYSEYAGMENFEESSTQQLLLRSVIGEFILQKIFEDSPWKALSNDRWAKWMEMMRPSK
jgi:hypothetical protein